MQAPYFVSQRKIFINSGKLYLLRAGSPLPIREGMKARRCVSTLKLKGISESLLYVGIGVEGGT